MFERLPDSYLIYIWVGALEEESTLMKLINNLRALQASQNPIQETYVPFSPIPLRTIPPREKLPIRRSPRFEVMQTKEFEIMSRLEKPMLLGIL